MKIKLSRKITSLLLALLLALNMSGLDLQALAVDEEIIAAWDYSAAPSSAAVPATSGTQQSGAVLTNFKNAIPTYNPSSLSVDGWEKGKDTRYWQISLSTKGYENLTLTARTRSSSTGPRDFKVIYSTDDGVTWKDVPNSAYAITSTTLSYFMPTLALPSGADDAEMLMLRFVMSSNSSCNAVMGLLTPNDLILPSGISNINNIVVKGTPIFNPFIVAGVTAAPVGSSLALGSKVVLSCETEGAVIMYSINRSEFIPYDPVEQVTLTELPAELRAYGTKEGMVDSAPSIWNYYEKQILWANSASRQQLAKEHCKD